MKLNEYSTEELQAEIEKRKMVRPEPLSNIELGKIVQYIEEFGMDVLKNGGPLDDYDFKQQIFERVMETIYGPSIWDWWNKQ